MTPEKARDIYYAERAKAINALTDNNLRVDQDKCDLAAWERVIEAIQQPARHLSDERDSMLRY